jgi:hypothetical protein
VTLHEVFEIYTQARDWAQAVEILERLVKVESGKTRARLLVAMGNILNYQLKITERAVEVYNLVLDEDPDDERTFGRIERILTAQNAWRELARNYRRMIKRMGSTPPPEKRAQLLALWRKLGDVCRRRLHEREAAIAAYEVCVQLAPEDRRYREVLADTYEVLGRQAEARRSRRARRCLRIRRTSRTWRRTSARWRACSASTRCTTVCTAPAPPGRDGASHSARTGLLRADHGARDPTCPRRADRIHVAALCAQPAPGMVRFPRACRGQRWRGHGAREGSPCRWGSIPRKRSTWRPITHRWGR